MIQAMTCAEQNMFVYDPITANMLVPPDKSMFTLEECIVTILVHAWMG